MNATCHLAAIPQLMTHLKLRDLSQLHTVYFQKERCVVIFCLKEMRCFTTKGLIVYTFQFPAIRRFLLLVPFILMISFVFLQV